MRRGVRTALSSQSMLGDRSPPRLHPQPSRPTAWLVMFKVVLGEVLESKSTPEKGTALLGTPAGKWAPDPLHLQPWDRHVLCVAASLPAARGEEAAPVEHTEHGSRNQNKAKCT